MTNLSGTEVKALRLVELRIMAAEVGLSYCSNLKKKDRIDLILGKREPGFKMARYVLMDIARKRE